MTLKVSVIVPTHNRPDSLVRAVDAILDQQVMPYELIIVNDGEENIPSDICDKAARAGVKYVYERRDTPSLPASRNCGLAVASGDIILFLEDDVMIPQDFVSTLTELYQADAAGLIGGIGGRVVEKTSPGKRVFDAASAMLGQGRWSPRKMAARYIELPAALRGKLVPARRLSGGLSSFRRNVTDQIKFEESFAGYALGEDREFSFRAAQRFALYVAPHLTAVHERAPGGRGDMKQLGRAYVANSLHIARCSVEGGAGKWLLVGCDFAGMMLLYAAYAIFGRNRMGKLKFISGMICELAGRACARLKETICGC